MDGAYSTFSDFYFPEPEDGWPVEFTFHWIHDKPTQYGRFVAVSPLLVEIFNQLLPATAMDEFLRDFRANIPVSRDKLASFRDLSPGEVNLTDNLAKQGFVVSSVDCFGVSLNVDIAWAFADNISGWKHITAGYIEFRPRCGKLNDGKWGGLRWHECIESHYFKRFAAIAPAKPIECLQGQEDIENLLKHFEWTKTTLHTETELRRMRIEAIGDAPELWSQPKQLAEFLKSRELYSVQTSVSQIMKFLPGLLKQAENTERK